MILYFSGTGNSQHAALQIAEKTADQAISINHFVKSGEKAVIRSERPLVFVAPTYCWRLPRLVEQWIMETEFEGSRDAYFILTCGADCGNAAVYAKRLCARKGLRFCGLAPVVMPENYLALFPTPGEAECRAIIERAKPVLADLAETIRAGKHFSKPSVTIGGRLESGPLNPLFYAFFVRDKGFTVSDACVSCGKCAVRCPMNNIEMKGGKPVWNGNCTHCMACIGGCPAKAIEYKSRSKGQHRHYIMKDNM